MGSRIIHFCVAIEILKRVDLDENQFILGNLAPDAYNPNRGGSLLSHFRIPEELMEYECVDLEKFKGKYSSHMSDHFVLGYYCHLITDNLWLKDAFKKYGNLGPDERSAAVKLVYSDYLVLNTILIDRFKLVYRNFKPSVALHIDEIEYDFLNALVENLRSDFNRKAISTSLIELNLYEILDFIKAAANECVRNIYILRGTIR